MALLTVQDLQDIAVSTTSDFYNHGTPLSVGLAKQAAARDLNSDQVKRAVEATNTLAYLKSVEGSDRTGEFPLADYDEIMKCASMPDDMQSTEPKVSIQSADETDDDLVKQASAALEFEMPELTKQAAMTHLIKEASKNKRALEDAQARAFHLVLDLEKAASELKKTPFAVEGMSLASNGTQFTKVARLTFGADAPTRIDWVEDVKMNREWKPAFEKAASLAKLLEQAQDTLAEIEHRSGLDKQAGLITTMAAGVGRAARSIVSAPFRFAANKVSAGVSAGIDTAATKAQSGFASTSLGKKMGIQPGTLKPSTVQTMKNSKRMIAGTTLAAGAGLDAISFRPHHDATKGTNGDVWDALN
jgi:hypothetical protein